MDRPDFTKSSAFSLVSMTTDINEKINTMKSVVEINFFNMYQSSIFILLNQAPLPQAVANVALKTKPPAVESLKRIKNLKVLHL